MIKPGQLFSHLFCLALAVGSHESIAYGKQNNEVFKYVDREGKIRYSDIPRHDGYVKMERTWKGWEEPTRGRSYQANFRRYTPFVQAAAQRHALSSALISAVIHAESYYNPHAVSSAGAVGLMQLMPATAKRYGVSNRQDPEQNIDGGVQYLSDLLNMFDNNVELALAAYNAGEQAVKRHGNRIPPYGETRHFVSKVLKLYQSYEQSAP